MRRDETHVALGRIQRYLGESRRQTLAKTRDIVPIGPFLAFFVRNDASSGRNMAFANTPDITALVPWLAPLRAAFAKHGRLAALECVVPDDPARATATRTALEQAGFIERERETLLLCTCDLLRPPAMPPQLSFVTVTDASPLEDVRETLDTNEFGFDPQFARPATNAQARAFLSHLHQGKAFTARWEGQAAGAGMIVHPVDGVCELAGITTLSEYRGRGIAASVTAFMTQAACEVGCDLVYLTTTNPIAERVYQRVGFTHAGALVTYRAAT